MENFKFIGDTNLEIFERITSKINEGFLKALRLFGLEEEFNEDNERRFKRFLKEVDGKITRYYYNDGSKDGMLFFIVKEDSYNSIGPKVDYITYGAEISMEIVNNYGNKRTETEN